MWDPLQIHPFWGPAFLLAHRLVSNPLWGTTSSLAHRAVSSSDTICNSSDSPLVDIVLFGFFLSSSPSRFSHWYKRCFVFLPNQCGISQYLNHINAGVRKDGLVRHFFHRPSKAYTTGTRKRRKVHADNTEGEGETRWHKTGKTRPVLVAGRVKGYKKILVLYTNYGKQKKPEKTNWIMHQYHLGASEEEKDGELVVSKVFYQTQPRQCGNSVKKDHNRHEDSSSSNNNPNPLVDFYNPSFVYFESSDQNRSASNSHMIPQFAVHDGSSAVSWLLLIIVLVCMNKFGEILMNKLGSVFKRCSWWGLVSDNLVCFCLKN